MSVDNYKARVPHALVIKTDSYTGNFIKVLRMFLIGNEYEYDHPGYDDFYQDARNYYKEVLTKHPELPQNDPNDAYTYISDSLTSIGCLGMQCTTDRNVYGEYTNVVIFFDAVPREPFLSAMVARIKDFPAAYRDKKISILGIEWQSYKTKVDIQTTIVTLI